MNTHLTQDELSAAVAGLDLDSAARAHLGACLACRQAVAAASAAIDTRRREQEAGAPDWDAQRARIMASIAGRPVGLAAPPARRRWLRPLVAAAALILAVAAGVLATRPHPLTPGPAEVSAERILAEVDAALADGEVPGFEALAPIVPQTGELELLLERESS